jgi:hypothetical protein
MSKAFLLFTFSTPEIFDGGRKVVGIQDWYFFGLTNKLIGHARKACKDEVRCSWKFVGWEHDVVSP